jgi:hypothetical protein
MTDKEWTDFFEVARTHTALGRVNHSELQTAFEKLAEFGYTFVAPPQARLEGSEA